MSNSDNAEGQDKKRPFSALLFALIIFAVLASILFYQKKKTENEAPYDEFSLSSLIGYSGFDLEKSVTPRVMGDEKAPVKITEYSSFTCGACGLFHGETFEKIKENYIDTGKAYFVFSDLPRNVEDVTIGAISRCIPQKSYFEFLDLIFETQKDWIESENPIKQVEEKAVIAGAEPKRINQCYNSEKLRKALVDDAKEALKEYKLAETPALVINDVHVLKGLDSYEKIRDAIEEELAKAEAKVKEEETKGAALAPASDFEQYASVVFAGGSAEDEEVQAFADMEPAFGEEASQSKLDIEKLVEPRILGNPDAPLKISDHSSYTCGACSKFHLDSFEKLKTEYIDTGKAYLVFDDFPRNGPDITIGAIARCVPEKAYFKFVELIFKTQQTWIRSDDYVNFIKQNAKLTGADPDLIEECARSMELQEALAARGQRIYEELNVDSTPTFIINDDKRLVGAVPYSQFKKTLDAELAKVKN